MCQFETSWSSAELQHPSVEESIARLQELEEDGLLLMNGQSMKVTEKGKAFVRNICMAFDARLMRNKPSTQLFSMTI
jgi:oxygen-independent coproporphyrinogen-3 oxidase